MRKELSEKELRREYFSRYNVGELLEEVRKLHAGKVS